MFPLVVVAASLFLLSHADFFTFNVNTNTTKQVNKEAAVKDTISIVREGGFNVSVVVPSQSCPRYGIVDTEYSGGGHRFAAFVVAFLLASETGDMKIIKQFFSFHFFALFRRFYFDCSSHLLAHSLPSWKL